jgi:hypothetical protein
MNPIKPMDLDSIHIDMQQSYDTWNDKHEKYMLLIHQYSNQLMKDYHHEYTKNQRKLCHYKIPVIILSSVTGFLSIANSGYVDEQNNKFVSLSCGIINLAISVISTIESFKKIGDKTNAALNTFKELRKLSDDISITLSIHRKDRQSDGKTLLIKYFNRFETILKESYVLKGISENMLRLKNQIHGLDQNMQDLHS